MGARYFCARHIERVMEAYYRKIVRLFFLSKNQKKTLHKVVFEAGGRIRSIVLIN